MARFFSLLAWLAAALTVTTAASVTTPAPEYPSCDTDKTGTLQPTQQPLLPQKMYPDNLIKFVGNATQGGACGIPYHESTALACVDPGFAGFSSINKEDKSKLGCGRWIQINNKELGTTADAMILETCGAGSTDQESIDFGCNDLFLSPKTFSIITGKDAVKDMNAGHLDPNEKKIDWSFQVTPCWACYAGLSGSRKPDGTLDQCDGVDAKGFTRCGLKTGKDRIVGDRVHHHCKVGAQCPK